MSRLLDNAIAVELSKLAHAQANIDEAHANGLISAHDCEERKARAEDWTAQRIAYLKGEPRPPHREPQPLDDPHAHQVD